MSINELDPDVIIEMANEIIDKPIMTNNTFNKNNMSIESKYTNIRDSYYLLLSKWLMSNNLRVHDSISIIYIIVCASSIYYESTEQKVADTIDAMNKVFRYIQPYISMLILKT